MSAHDPNLELFSARVKRIRDQAPNTASTLYVGLDLSFDKAAIRKRAKPKRKGRGWLLGAMAAPLVAFSVLSLRDSGVTMAGVMADPVSAILGFARFAGSMLGFSGAN